VHGSVALLLQVLHRYPQQLEEQAMSKLRQRDYTFDKELAPSNDVALNSYIVYTCKKDGSPHRYAGYLNAPDIHLAVEYACEHYGQDEVCVNIWLHHVDALRETACAEKSVDLTLGCDGQDTATDPAWAVFTQRKRGDIHIEAGALNAPDADTAFKRAIARYGKNVVQVRVVPLDQITSTTRNQLIWRTHDQTYRLARGYSKSVRMKWAAVRNADDINEYVKDDIESHF
jgi:1,2-phenylacetyl-CoA epoxidase PaaB subunit